MLVIGLAVLAALGCVLGYVTDERWVAWVGFAAALLALLAAGGPLLQRALRERRTSAASGGPTEGKAHNKEPGREHADAGDKSGEVAPIVESDATSDTGEKADGARGTGPVRVVEAVRNSRKERRDVSDAAARESRSAPGVADKAGSAAAAGPSYVHVIPGRRRFHRDDCSLLSGHDVETITEDEARDEGFTPCTRCGA